MKYSLTYLDNSTIITSGDGLMIIIDKNLEGWKQERFAGCRSGFGTITFKFECYEIEVHQYNNLNRDTNGIIRWYRNGRLHRDGGPAVIWPDGARFWYQNGTQIQEPK